MNKLRRISAPHVVACLLLPMAVKFGVLPGDAQASVLLEEIIVTARKREESLQDAPVVMSAFSRETLEAYNINRMEDIAAMTPGLIIGEANAPTGGTIAMRGVHTGTANPAFDQAVAVVIDGMAVNHAGILRVSQIDIQQVEILKGPQALFFGKNSPGGVISFRTSDPGDDFEWSLRSGYEFEAAERYIEGVISGRLSEAVALRLVASYSDMDGWLVNDPDPAYIGFLSGGADHRRLPQSEERFFRGTLLLDPSDRVSMRSKVSLNRTKGSPYFSASQIVRCPLGQPQGSPTDNCKADNKTDKATMLQELVDWNPIADGNPNNRGEIEWLMASHEMRFKLGDSLELVSLTGYVDGEDEQVTVFSTGSLAFFGGAIQLDQRRLTQEVRLSTMFDGPANFMVGAFYSDEEVTSEIAVAISGITMGLPGVAIPLAPPESIQTQDTRSRSVFGQINWKLTDTVELSAGARWSRDEKDFDVSEAGVKVTNIVPRRTFTNTSPELTIAWYPSDRATYFASYKEGFKSGGFNINFLQGGYGVQAPNVIDRSYGQETVDGLEVGAKWLLDDERLRLAAALYRYKYDDMQLSSFDPASISIAVQNAGASTVKGLEAELVYLPPVEGLTLRLAAAFNRAEFDEFISPCYSAQTAAQGCNLFGGLAQDLSGKTLPTAPKTTAAAGFTYERRLTGALTLSTSWDLEYSSDYFTQQELARRSRQGSYTRLNGNVSLGHDAGWQVSFIGRNLTEEYVMTTGADSLFTGNAALGIPSDYFASVSRGRQVYVQLKLNSNLLRR